MTKKTKRGDTVVLRMTADDALNIMSFYDRQVDELRKILENKDENPFILAVAKKEFVRIKKMRLNLVRRIKFLGKMKNMEKVNETRSKTDSKYYVPEVNEGIEVDID